MKIAAIIPAYNEEGRIRDVIRETKDHVNRIIVIDDGSTDGTSTVAKEAGAEVISHKQNKGYLAALRTGFRSVREDIVVTIDADGENNPKDIPKLVALIKERRADLVLGRRKHVPRASERFLDFLTSFAVDVSDTGTGFRALKIDLAKKLKLEGKCPCGTFILEVAKLGGKIQEIPVRVRKIDKPKKVAWKHLIQIFYVLKLLFHFRRERNV